MLRLWVLYNFRKDMFMRDNGKIMKEMEEEFSSGKMVQSIKVIGKIMLLLNMVDLYMLMEMSI